MLLLDYINMIPILGNIRVLIIILFFPEALSADLNITVLYKNQIRLMKVTILYSLLLCSSRANNLWYVIFRSKDQLVTEIPMSYVGGNWEAVIPGRNVVAGGLRIFMYYIKIMGTFFSTNE